MAKLVRAVQPYCAENIVAAMPCSRADTDSGGSNLFRLRSKDLASGMQPSGISGRLPERVFLALGSRWIYAFNYAPQLVGFKIKERVACWPRDEVSALAEYTSTMVYFVMRTRSGESHALEVSAMSAPVGRPAVEFLHILGAVDYRSTLK